MKQKGVRETKGITLIALVITIIVMLILVGVSISIIIGDNSIFKVALDSKRQAAIAAKKEEVQIAITTVVLSHNGDSSAVTISEVVAEVQNGYLIQAEKSAITGETTGEEEDKFPGKIIYNPPASTIDETIVIEIDQNLNIISAGTEKKEGDLADGSEIKEFTDGIEEFTPPQSAYIKVGSLYVNSPDLSGFDPESTYYVTYDSTGENEKVLGRIDRIGINKNQAVVNSKETSNIWYDYENKIWANVVTIVGDDVTYWTWIPRYKYNPTGSSASSVTVKFVDNKDICKDETGANVDLTGYELPDSFAFDTAQNLNGFWISKYEIQDLSVDTMTTQIKDGKITINTQNASGKYAIYVNGKIFKTGVRLPYEIDGVKTINACDICLYSEESNRMIGRTNRDTNIIEVDTTGFDAEHTYYIAYDSSGENETIVGRMDKVLPNNNLVGKENSNIWYDYSSKIWANVVTVTGENVTYWTYVPRYEYLKDQTTIPLNTRFISSTQTVADVEYEIPDAFEFDNKPIKGYWMSKYEIQDANSNGVEKITISEQTSNKITVKTTLTDTSPNRTYYIYLNGNKYKKDAVKLPYTVNVTSGTGNSIMLYSVDDKRVIGETSTLPASIIEVDGSGFSVADTYYVLYDADGSNERIGGNIELDSKGNIKVPETNRGTWYNYENKIWANVVTKGKDKYTREIITYWTYIPRYEYLETSTSTSVGAQFIPQSQTTPDNGYIISDAFTFDNKPLKGYWMSKYEVQKDELKDNISEDGGYICNSDGIIETGISITGNYKIELQMKMDSFPSSYNNIWGTGNSNFESWVPKSGKQLCFRSNNTKFTSSNTMTTGVKYTITEEVNNGTITANVKTEDGVFENWITGSVGSGTSSSTLKLFSTTSNTCATNMIMYYFKVYKEGQLVLDIVPVKYGDIIDGQTMNINGLYDKVSKTIKY